MGAPTVYSWDDPGAPAWPANANGLGFYEVIKACLVDGYGSKAAAGWGVVYDDFVESGNFSITNGPQTGVLGLYHSRASGVQIYEPLLYVAEAMSTYDTPINGKSLSMAISQTGFSYAWNSLVHGVGSYKGSGSNHSPRWIVIANENWAWVSFASSLSGHDVFNANPPTLITHQWASCPVVGFGAINSPLAVYGEGDSVSLGNFHIIGGARNVGLGFPGASISGGACWTGLRDHEGMPTSRLDCHLLPFSPTYQCAGTLYESQLIQATVYSSPNSSAISVGSIQLGRCPGMFGWRDLWRFHSSDHMALHHPGGVTFKDVITLDGRRFIYGVEGPVPIFFSLEAADW